MAYFEIPDRASVIIQICARQLLGEVGVLLCGIDFDLGDVRRLNLKRRQRWILRHVEKGIDGR